MSEIQGLGPTQPLRPASPASRPSSARPDEGLESHSSFGSDAVHVSSRPLSIVPVPAVNEVVVPQPPAPVAPKIEVPRIDEVDGFLFAGGGQAPTGLSRGADACPPFSAGPIAMIDEPAQAPAGLPNLALNGPSTAAQGLYSLGGMRLA